MKKRILLHIGTHKTGTTALQQVFAENRDTLAAAGICYPDTSREPHAHQPKHSSLFFAAVHDPKAFPKEIEIMQEEADARNCHTILISAEGFSEPFFDKFDVFSSLSASYDIEIYCMLRRQDRFLESLWNQVIKQGQAVGPIPAFCATPKARLRGDYVRLLDFWGKIGTVNVVDYDTARLGGLVAHFVRWARLPDLPEAIQTNSSLGMNNALIRSWYNAAKVKPSRILLNAMEGDLRRLALGSKLRKELLEEFAPANAVLKERYGIAFSDELPEGEEPYPLVTPEPSFLISLLDYLVEGEEAMRADPDDLRIAASVLRRNRPEVALRLAQVGLAMRPANAPLNEIAEKIAQDQVQTMESAPASSSSGI